MALPKGITGDAFPRGIAPYRHWLSRTWDACGPVALVVGINPNKATEKSEDGMTGFLSRFLRTLDGDYKCGGFILVNCCDARDAKPENLEAHPAPRSKKNSASVRTQLARCDFVIASWGITDHGPKFVSARSAVETLIRRSEKPVVCFDPDGLPVYLSQLHKNNGLLTGPYPWKS